MLLSTYSAQLNVAVALGVGLAAVVGTLMLLRGWTLRRVLGCSLLPAVLLSAATLCDPQLQQVVGLAWDTGAVTTGPVTVPIVLALGRGLAQSRAHAAAASGPGFRLPASASAPATPSGFGIVALAGIYPVSCVLLLASYVQHFPPSPEVRTLQPADPHTHTRAHTRSPPPSQQTANEVKSWIEAHSHHDASSTCTCTCTCTCTPCQRLSYYGYTCYGYG